MELPLQPKLYFNIECLKYFVSILVLMELPLQLLATLHDLENNRTSFNPCFNGTTSATVSILIDEVFSS